MDLTTCLSTASLPTWLSPTDNWPPHPSSCCNFLINLPSMNSNRSFLPYLPKPFCHNSHHSSRLSSQHVIFKKGSHCTAQVKPWTQQSSSLSLLSARIIAATIPSKVPSFLDQLQSTPKFYAFFKKYLLDFLFFHLFPRRKCSLGFYQESFCYIWPVFKES